MKLPNWQRYELAVYADPGTAISPFAVLFIAFDRYLPYVYFLDEIYETDPERTVPSIVCPAIKEKCAKYTNDYTDWKLYYDVAAAWFKLGALTSYQMVFIPVEKRAGDKEEGIDKLQELFIQDKIRISTNCPNTIWEFDNYFKDKNGKFIKKNDNQIDNARYFIKMSRLVIESRENPNNSNIAKRKARSRDHSVDGLKAKKDKYKWISKVMKNYE